MDTLPRRLRMLRRQANKTLADVADAASISVSFLSDMEHGRTLPALDTLERIASVFNLSIGELLVNVRITLDDE
ncbi:MAG TPA: helix-turn-helix transcriptional regulator [Ktedonobacterales bacterium]|nr:helix-turn-helix transcriptional regulator [Ktedonobacterales bacterium]